MPRTQSGSSSQQRSSFRLSSQRSYVDDEEGGIQPVEASTSSVNEHDIDEKDVLRVLITTDNHVGFLERDPVRKDDSFITFEEIIQYGHKYNVDFVLQGGDLFHDNKPSRDTLHKTIAILRKNVFGDKPVPLQILSDQSLNFKSNPEGTVNYEDPNVNISLPIFAISGNHDAWSGENSLSVLDVLAQCNLINYFGKCETVDNIQVKPILIQKGETKLALYGLGYIRDERLYQTFKNQKVTFFRPSGGEDSQGTNEWFNLMTIHQNRNQHHTKKGNISESMLKGFFDLVMWGHEHEQQVVPTKSATGGFEVMQPGSSISTTYTHQEAKPKKVAVLEIYKDSFRVIPITLKTVRPYVFDSISLSDFEQDLKHIKNNPDEIADFLKEHVNQLIKQAKEDKLSSFEGDEDALKELKAYYKKYPGLDLPIIRLRVDYSGGYASVNPQRFGQNFVGKIANPSDLLLLSRKKTKEEDTVEDEEEVEEEKGKKKKDKKRKTKEQLLNAILTNDNNSELFADAASDALTDGIKIEDLVSHFLKETSTKKTNINGLLVLNEFEFQNSVVDFVDKEEAHAIDDFVASDIKAKQKKLWSDLKQASKDDISESDLEKYLQQYREEYKNSLDHDKVMTDRLSKTTKSEDKSDEEDILEEEIVDKKKSTGGRKKKNDSDEEEEEKPKPKRNTRKKKNDSDEEEEEKPKPKKRASRKKKNDSDEEEEEKPKKRGAKRKKNDSDEEEEEKPKKTRGKAATTKKAKFKSIDVDEEEVEEEEKPKRRGRPKKTEEKPKKASSSRSKKKVVDEDDEDAIVIDDEE